MITPINSINTRIQTENKLNKTKNATPSFNGVKVKLPSGEYPINDIRAAKQIIKASGSEWKDSFFNKAFEKQKDSHYAILTTSKTKVGRGLDRINIAIISLGMSEPLYFIPRYFKDRAKAKNYLKYMSKIVNDLKTNQIKESAVKVKKDNLAENRRLEFIEKKKEVEEKRIQPEILDVIQRQREGKPVIMPNNIMIANKNPEINEYLINWTKDRANANVITTNSEKYEEALESAEKQYQQTGDWNLIHVKNMEDLINPKVSDEATIEAMKEYMNVSAKDYHSTVIFSSTDPSKLDYIALQPHRVKQIDVSDLKDSKTASVEDAISRITDKTAQKETPLGVINDLLYIVSGNPKNEVRWEDSMSNTVNRDVRSFIRDKLFLEKDPKAGKKIESGEEYEKIFDKLITKEEYQDTLAKIEDPKEYQKAVIDVYKSRNFDKNDESIKYMQILNEAVKNVR